MITVYTITYNEEVVLPFFISHYRKNFPNCNIIIYDNESTDNTIKIAKDNDCEVISYSTNNQLSDSKYLEIKNNCWKNADTDWVVVCDCDELIFINENQLKEEDSNGTNIIFVEGFSIMNLDNEFSIEHLNMGFKDAGFDKKIMFNKKKLAQINYGPGGHSCNPKANNGFNIKYSDSKYKLIHYKYLSPNYTVSRHGLFGKRLSQENRSRGWGVHYTFSPESILSFYKEKSKNLIKII